MEKFNLLFFMKTSKDEEYYILDKIEDIAAFTELFLKKVPRPSCIAISGEMGSGKTTLITAILNAMGVADLQGSPTYSIIQSYILPSKVRCYHLDTYRIENNKEAYEIGLEELFEEDAYFFVEWPEKILEFLPPNTIWMYIREIEHQKRQITFKDDN
jgi:tRNA threonylcarbamoyladenosine biosynthesis protein TsaE